MKRLDANKGMLYFMVKQLRPELAKKIDETGIIRTAVVGLGGQGTKHAGLMRDFGTTVTAGVAVGKGGTRIHETIPVFDTIQDCLKAHPDIVAVSIWRHYTSARESALECIEAGIPLVILITEGIPLRDVRDILVAARKHDTLLIGGNTPGVIFPPEGIKIGMLPDVFYPEELSENSFGPRGVTIISRSGAILYHLSDALANSGIAQNAVIGVGGDGAIGSTFRRLVPLAMAYPNTDVVVIAGEIGGCQEELLAKEIKEHPERYPKPIIAEISGAHAPEGKTMGHAGAIISPGQEVGTFRSKKAALESAGVIVVNSQYDLIEAVKAKLGSKRYFKPENYFKKMRETWEAPPPKTTWSTRITKAEPNNIMIAGYPLQDLAGKKGLLEVAHLLVVGEFPDSETKAKLEKLAVKAAKSPAPKVEWREGEDISKALSKCLLADEELFKFKGSSVELTAVCLGRTASYLAALFGNEPALKKLKKSEHLADFIYTAITGDSNVDPKLAGLLESMISMCVDHGVTPPSAQATIIAATVRADFAAAIASGIGAITNVHGGAGAEAATFFMECVKKASTEKKPIDATLREMIEAYSGQGKRISGLGHRMHTQDPRRDVIWKLAETAGVAGKHVEASKHISAIFESVKGMSLPINVDGVIGAVVADMKLKPATAKVLFIYGRMAGLAAHYFEEITMQRPMRQIEFSKAVYSGPGKRQIE